MPNIYTLQQKRHALYLLDQLASVAAVSQQLDIPERTLRDWQLDRTRGQLRAAKDPSLAYQGGAGSITIAEIRDRLLAQVEKLTRHLSDDPRKAYFAALAINHYLDQIRTLNEVLDTTPPDDP